MKRKTVGLRFLATVTGLVAIWSVSSVLAASDPDDNSGRSVMGSFSSSGGSLCIGGNYPMVYYGGSGVTIDPYSGPFVILGSSIPPSNYMVVFNGLTFGDAVGSVEADGTPPVPADYTLPEPATLLLLMVGALGLIRRRR